MQASDRDAAPIIKPNNHPAPLGINPCVLSTGDAIAIATACHDQKRLKRSGVQKLSNIRDHAWQATQKIQQTQAVEGCKSRRTEE